MHKQYLNALYLNTNKIIDHKYDKRRSFLRMFKQDK